MTKTGRPGPGAERFADLRLRLLSAAALLTLGVVALWLGGRTFETVIVIAAGLMTWELARLGDPGRPALAMVIAAATALSILGAIEKPLLPESAVIVLGPALFLITPRRDKLLAAFWTLLVAMATVQLVEARTTSLASALFLLGVVIVSDAAGYFAGRLIGGPKIWPAISPKKTWSGTVAGWLAATLWAVLLSHWIVADPAWALVALAPVLALAGQLADLFESWMKRRAGVKDISNLIPGHGGVMDRFDALTGAAALGMALEWLRQALGG
jgi:phosphatidate cytidylyltransferase